jgi:hypothetical protein
MYGFFHWDLPSHMSPTTAQCPNCGAIVERGLVTAHACEDERILEHHTLLLSRGFHALPGKYRNAGGPRENLLHWRPFSEWLGSPQGRFAVYVAEHSH